MFKIGLAVFMTCAIALTGCAEEAKPVTATVSKTERVCFKTKDCRYLVYTDVETFEITDTWTRHNSADVYGKIRNDKKYEFKVIGFRSESTSKYRNIMDLKEVK